MSKPFHIPHHHHHHPNLWRCGPTRAMASSFLRFLDHTQRRTTVGRTPLDAWSVRRRDLYLTTHNTHNNRHPCPRWDSNPQTQQARGRSPTTWTTRPMGPAIIPHYNYILVLATLKIATWVVETCPWPLWSKTTLIKLKWFCWSFNKFYTSN